MKRTKSILSMRNLAASIKQSIQLDAQRNPPFQPLKTTKSLATLIPQQRYSHAPGEEHPVRKQQKDNKIFVLEKQIATLEKQLKNSSSDARGYDADLALYDEVAKKLSQTERAINLQKSTVQQAKDQILMLQEEVHSVQFNIEENMAEKEYHEELIETYRHQYEGESKLVFTIVDLEFKNIKIKGEITGIEQASEKSQVELEQWKKEIEFDLNEHKLKNSIKIIRMKLIELQDQCDTFCTNSNLRKVRELYCLYFKNHAKANGIGNEEAEDGLDIFICKHALTQDFSQFVRERLIYNKPKFPLLQQYLSTLMEMQQVFRKSIYEANRKIHSLLQFDIKQLERSRKEKMKEIQENQERVRVLNEQIDDLFNNESIAVIEYMRQKNRNKYDLKEIKAKLRENKKEQRHRIAKIRNSFQKVSEFECILDNSTMKNVRNINKQFIEELTQTLIQAELHQQQLERRLAKQRREKEDVEDRISSEITKWRQVDEKKDKLKNLYQELQSAKKLEINREERQEYKITKNQQQISTNRSHACLDDKPTRLDLYDNLKQINQSKNTSISSLNQSKSVLSLSNPFRKVLEKSVKETYQPILSNCQLILSRKLTHKDLQINDLQSRSSNILKEKNMNQTASKKISIPKEKPKNSENTLWSIKNKSVAITPYKQTSQTINSKGKICLSQRQSLSKLLISKFNR